MIVLLEALDALRLALASHNHEWTDSERQIYEAALAEITDEAADCMAIGSPVLVRH